MESSSPSPVDFSCPQKEEIDPWEEILSVQGERKKEPHIPSFSFSKEESKQDLCESLMRLWTCQVLYGDKFLEKELLPVQVFVRSDPFLQALVAVIQPSLGFFSPPVFETGLDLLDKLKARTKIPFLAQLCQLALFWQMGGQAKAAQQLASWLYPFVQRKMSLMLWCKEEDYNEKEGFLSVSLFLKAVGDLEGAKRALQKTAEDIPPFYLALAKQLQPISMQQLEKSRGVEELQGEGFWGLSTLQGSQSSLGHIRFQEVEICALGPQGYPLAEAHRFGIEQTTKEDAAGWTCCSADREIWFQPQWTVQKESLLLRLRWVGLKPDSHLAFAFYVKAEQCQVGDFVLKPRHLQRYTGSLKKVSLSKEKTCLHIESPSFLEGQIVPLSGEGNFWNADFLIAFELRAIESEVVFEIKK